MGVTAAPLEMPATSTEYVHIPVSAADQADGPPDIAIVTHKNNPAGDEWIAAEWDGDDARILYGPDGGAIDLAPGGYWIWVRFTTGSETPVRRAGRLHLT